VNQLDVSSSFSFSPGCTVRWVLIRGDIKPLLRACAVDLLDPVGNKGVEAVCIIIYVAQDYL